MPTEISAPLHFQTLLNAHTYLVADFYATWCGPCKAIAPSYTQLSKAHTQPNKLAFVKVNVDEQREVAAKYGITAMPTFLLFKDGKVVETIRGANPPALKKAVEGAAKDITATAATAASASAPEKKTEPVKEAKKVDVEVEETTVSGSYGMTGSKHWRESLY
ncbi:thioredoxin-domain-containing protein [Polyplosphaeria fusca]|uniref:Thioredoxin-domain-containing protein n=1 Tax=Polyplosphaeria fusca TaxID=682080 RepID=A0A9P4QZU8_9PLEO|nr:thioredoxin-domain-containing protein [Polyplosphaeria fusca]